MLKTDRAHFSFMDLALAEARKARRKDEVPIGALVVSGGKIIARAHNLTCTKKDPTAHAEILALQKAAVVLKNERLTGTTLYVTLEPCAMCAGAMVWARVQTLVFGATDKKAGACGSVVTVVPNPELNHRPSVISGVREKQSAQILKSFFRQKRKRSLK